MTKIDIFVSIKNTLSTRIFLRKNTEMPVGPVNGGGLEAIKREAFTDKENIRNLSEQIELDQNKSEEMEKKGYTVIRVKRKVTDDPEKGLQLTAKKVFIVFQISFQRKNYLPIFRVKVGEFD